MEPLTPPECDLRGLPFMPLDVVRLVDSDLAAIASGDEFKAAVILWCKAWLQVPAASLPDDDRILAHLSGAGSRWPKLRAVALRGWVKCEDGRLYHPVVAEKAREAWSFRLRQRERSAKANSVRWASPPASPRGSPRASPEDPKGQGQGHKTEATPLPPAAPLDARGVLWSEGLSRLRRITGKPDGAARGLLGRFCKEAADDCALVSSLLHEAERDRPGDPVAWISAAIQARTGRRGTSSPRRESNLAWMGDMLRPAEPTAPRFDLDLSAEEIPT